jgi:hypothetical protein
LAEIPSRSTDRTFEAASLSYEVAGPPAFEGMYGGGRLILEKQFCPEPLVEGRRTPKRRGQKHWIYTASGAHDLKWAGVPHPYFLAASRGLFHLLLVIRCGFYAPDEAFEGK